MSQKLPVDGFEWIEEDLLKLSAIFMENYNGNSDKAYILEVDVEYPKNLHKLHSDLPFLPEKMKTNKYNRLACTVQDKEKLCCLHKSFKTSIKSRINTKKST